MINLPDKLRAVAAELRGATNVRWINKDGIDLADLMEEAALSIDQLTNNPMAVTGASQGSQPQA
jgi:hypothetical protein